MKLLLKKLPKPEPEFDEVNFQPYFVVSHNFYNERLEILGAFIDREGAQDFIEVRSKKLGRPAFEYSIREIKK